MPKLFISKTRGNIISEMNNDIYFTWENTRRVDFLETKSIEDHGNEVRAFSFTPDGFKIQLRGYKKLTPTGKVRNVIATSYLTKEDLEYLLDRIKNDPFKNSL